MKRIKSVKLNRGAGVLLPISSLPSPYGIGTLGIEGYKFIDLLVGAGQKYWQVLPIGPTSYGDSPYQSFSAFAGNPYFIDLDYLVEEDLLYKEEIKAYIWGENESYIEYATIFENRFEILKCAFERSKHEKTKEYIEFCKENEYWLEDYCLFMALKFHFKNQEWLLWNDDIRLRKKDALKKYKKELHREISFWKFSQFKVYEQWTKLKKYANENGIKIIGDIPLYVSMDSSDVWVHGDLFELDENKNPINVAGVPPDAFSSDGQRWGNPLYDWTKMENSDFTWWKERMKSNANLYDVIRIDHFIGIATYYSIPSECKTAVIGCWRKGPGKKLTDTIMESIGDAQIIAEDLGVVFPVVAKLLQKTGFPGMKVIQFAFDGGATNPHLPHNYASDNIVAYTGTHDNETLVGFLNNLQPKKMKYLCQYFDVKSKKDLPDKIIKSLYATNVDIVICQVQDFIKLDNAARTNIPSTVGLNWRWRITQNQLNEINVDLLKQNVELYGR